MRETNIDMDYFDVNKGEQVWDSDLKLVWVPLFAAWISLVGVTAF